MLQALAHFREAGLWAEGEGGKPVVCASPLPVMLPGVGLVPSYIDKERLAAVPLKQWTGPTHVVQSVPEALDAVAYIVCELGRSSNPEDRVLGFDAEFRTRPGQFGPPPPSVIQVGRLPYCWRAGVRCHASILERAAPVACVNLLRCNLAPSGNAADSHQQACTLDNQPSVGNR
jgi:hypothetical protein